jgi:amidophosphoribosyltransferase
VNQLLFDGLTVLQHRGQDAAGMVTAERRRLHLRKDNGLVRDVFHTHHMLELRGNVGIGHCRYPTAGSSSCAEAQPLYTNYPYGICVAHNGNITNTQELTEYLQETCGRHVNTESDSELLLNIFADALTKQEKSKSMTDIILDAMEAVMGKCIGGYAGLYLINGIGLVAFRDPHGIRPLVFGCRNSTEKQTDGRQDVMSTPSKMPANPNAKVDYVVASESVAIDTLGFDLVR